MKKNNRVKVPTVLQMEAVECGAASLAMVLAYFGRYVPLEELRVVCGVSRDGSKAVNLLKAARKYGLEAKGFRKEPDTIRDLELPLIIHWNFNHFLVLEGFKNGKVYLNDPGSGRRIVSEEDFNQLFTGIVMEFKKTDQFVTDKRKPNIFDSLRYRLRGSETALLFIILVGLALVIPGLVIPVFTRIFIDDILLGSKDYWLMPLLLGMGITAALRGILTWMQQYYLLRMETKISLATSSQFFWHILRLPTEFFSQRSAGDITSRMQSNDRVAQLLSGKLAETTLNFVMIFFYFIIMVQYNLMLAMVGLAIAVLNVLYLKIVSEKRVDQNRKLLKNRGKLMGTGMNGLQIIETLKATGSEESFFSRWSGYQAKALNSEQELGVSTQFLSVFPEFLTAINNTIILTLGGFLILEGQMTIGMLVAFQSLMSSFMTPVTGLVGLGAELQEVEGEMNRLDDVLKYPMVAESADSQNQDETSAGAKLKGFVELKNMSFGYSPLEPPLIEDFSLRLRPGARVALVGGSGCGKSTIAKVIAGIFVPWSGTVLFDGVPRDNLPRIMINNSMAMIDQEISMFNGTIRENITLWDQTISEFQMVKAAKDASIHDDITARPEAYEHMVEEDGKNFSGGQRQRLEIARALAQNPTILIMDEATSALDPLTEKKVDTQIRRRGCTCIIVAHRLSTIRDCDEIIVLDKGKIVERGTHEELQAKNGLYASLIQTA